MENLKEILEKAIDYASDTDWDIFNRPDRIMERVKTAKNVCAFGAGNFYIENFSWITDLDKACKYVCDNNPGKWGKLICGRPCITLEELQRLEDAVVIISIGEYREAERQLKELGIECYPLEAVIIRTCDTVRHGREYFNQNRGRILEALDILEDEMSKEIYVNDICLKIAPHLALKSYSELKNKGQEQYFKTDVLALTDTESFVDAGAYVGDSLLDFIEAVNDQYENAYCFELEKENYGQLCKTAMEAERHERIKCYWAGVSDDNISCRIGGAGNGWRVGESGDFDAQLVKLDDVLADEPVTLLKMDIEGSEMKALHGSAGIIKTRLPKLAVCTYHMLSHIWEVPLFIHSTDPKYHIFLRHHSDTVWDTVCYAHI